MFRKYFLSYFSLYSIEYIEFKVSKFMKIDSFTERDFLDKTIYLGCRN